jgi:hypothetical protein
MPDEAGIFLLNFFNGYIRIYIQPLKSMPWRHALGSLERIPLSANRFQSDPAAAGKCESRIADPKAANSSDMLKALIYYYLPASLMFPRFEKEIRAKSGI